MLYWRSTAHLTTKTQHLTKGNHRAAHRIESYLNEMMRTVNHGINIKCTELKFQWFQFLCASWASHYDGSSHAGWILKFGYSFLGSKSSKQRVASPSYTDADIIATVDGWKYLKSLDNLFCEIGLPIVICKLWRTNLKSEDASDMGDNDCDF